MWLLITTITCLVHIAAAAAKIEWLDCSKNVPPILEATFPGTDVSDLPSTLHCGHLVVPMDYSRPMGADNNITINLAMHRPKDPKGVLFFCPGGTDPGALVAWQIALNINSPFLPSFDGLLQYDIMMMDIRGTFESNPLNVSLELAGAMFQPFPSNASQYRAFEIVAKEMFTSWEDSSSPPGIIQFVGTREVVQDYESIRAALGYDKINFLGCSYGSFRAAGYAAKYPRRVGNFALDSVVPHGQPNIIQARDQIKMATRSLLRADAFCQNNASCPFHSAGKGSVPAAFETILERAANGTLLSCASKKKSCAQSLSTYEVQFATMAAFGDQPNFPLILEAFALAFAGDGEGFIGSPSTPTQELEGVWEFPLICSDNHVQDPTFEGLQKMLHYADKIDIYNLSQAEALTIQLICSAFPYPVPPQKVLEPDAAMLLVTADFDGSAQTEGTTFAYEHYPNSGLVVRHGDDHVSFNLPEQESTRITKEFLRTGVLPCAKEDTFVTVYGPRAPREPPVANPYDVPTGFVAGDIDSA